MYTITIRYADGRQVTRRFRFRPTATYWLGWMLQRGFVLTVTIVRPGQNE